MTEAAVSPFLATDIPLRATLIAGYDAKAGASVRALLHIDATNLTFTPDQATGTRMAKVDVVGIVVDEWGVPLSQRASHFTATLDSNADDRVLQAGIVYSLIVPVKRAGGFQVRFAVRDEASGALGAASEFVEIPEVKKGGLALSGVVLGEESQAVATPGDEMATMARISSPALRVFAPGTRLVYTYEIYNAAVPVDTTVTVWRDGRPLFQRAAGHSDAAAKAPAHQSRRRHPTRPAHATRRLRLPGIRRHATHWAEQAKDGDAMDEFRSARHALRPDTTTMARRRDGAMELKKQSLRPSCHL